ncbi:hypothetical protein BRADI_1g58687v3 [Brachypodium distachyon]|uniref:Uncharacterized protein n=1 Tax=Brachypodium distachyon TaxID=15368 RepID=A0A0Q3NUC7_BRADI|nr:hypothetical protein BRADI_1g58687v3 [Brachypodium distachyon]
MLKYMLAGISHGESDEPVVATRDTFLFELTVDNLLCLHLTVSYKGELSKFKLRTEVKKMFCDMKSLFCPRAYFDPCYLAIQVNQELSGYFPIDLCFR